MDHPAVVTLEEFDEWIKNLRTLQPKNQLVRVESSVLVRRIPESEYQNLVQQNRTLKNRVYLLQRKCRATTKKE